jgi:hypothetical protein
MLCFRKCQRNKNLKLVKHKSLNSYTFLIVSTKQIKEQTQTNANLIIALFSDLQSDAIKVLVALGTRTYDIPWVEFMFTSLEDRQ